MQLLGVLIAVLSLCRAAFEELRVIQDIPDIKQLKASHAGAFIKIDDQKWMFYDVEDESKDHVILDAPFSLSVDESGLVVAMQDADSKHALIHRTKGQVKRFPLNQPGHDLIMVDPKGTELIHFHSQFSDKSIAADYYPFCACTIILGITSIILSLIQVDLDLSKIVGFNIVTIVVLYFLRNTMTKAWRATYERYSKEADNLKHKFPYMSQRFAIGSLDTPIDRLMSYAAEDNPRFFSDEAKLLSAPYIYYTSSRSINKALALSEEKSIFSQGTMFLGLDKWSKVFNIKPSNIIVVSSPSGGMKAVCQYKTNYLKTKAGWQVGLYRKSRSPK